MSQISVPWRMLVPVVVIIGIAASLWGGAYMTRNAFSDWETRIESYANVKTHAVANEWQRVLSYTESAADIRNADNFGVTGNDAIKRFSAVQAIFLIEIEGVVRALPPKIIPVRDLSNMAAQLVPFLPKPEVGKPVKAKIVAPEGQIAVLTYLPPEKAERSMVMAVPVLDHPNAAWLVLVLDVESLLRDGILNSGNAEQASLGVEVTSKDGQILFQREIFKRAEKHNIFSYSRNIVVNLPMAGRNWRFIWSFDEQSLTGANWTPGVMLAFMGAILTIIFGLAFWGQQSVARHIRAKVSERTSQLEQASRKFRLITDNAYDLIAMVNTHGVVEYVNSTYFRVLGYSREDMKNKVITKFVHPKDIDAFKRMLQDVVEGRSTTGEMSFRIRHKKGHWLYLEGVSKGLHNSNWQTTGVVVHARDITSRKRFAEELAKSEQRFRDFADASADWLWEMDATRKFTYVSPGIKSVLGYMPDEMVGIMHFDDLLAEDDESQSSAEEVIEARIQRHQAFREMEFWTQSKNEERVYLRISAVPVFDEHQQFAGYRGAATNITASKIDRDRMARMATTDELTKLLNRARFVEHLEHNVNIARRHGSQGVLMFIDLDRFKEINDSHGHDAGDTILRAVADILRNSVRSTSEDVVARLGGDEFAIIMPGISPEQASLKVQGIIDQISNLEVDYNGAKLSVTMSVGMVTFPQEGKDSAALVMSADLAMYRAKDMGRNRIYVDAGDDDDTTKDSVREQLKWLDHLRKALDHDTFEMHYQPIVPMDSSKPTIFEALIRLRDDEGRIGPPYLYIDAAEHFGMIQKLDLAVIERCIGTHARFKTELGKDLHLSINLSGKSIGDPEVINKLKEMAISYGEKITPQYITFEVTETQALTNMTSAKDINVIRDFIDDLRALGFKFAIDDFGQGYSSFSNLRSLNIDVIKLDGAYIKDLDTSQTDRLFVRSISDLARGLDIRSIAEFVENSKILEIINELGVDYAQGYHLQKPDPDIEGLVDKFAGLCALDFIEADTSEKSPSKSATKKAKAAPKTAKPKPKKTS